MRKKFTPSQKAKVALEALTGSKTIAQISSIYGVHSTQINEWKKQAREKLELLFSDKRAKEGRQEERLVAELYQLIGQRDIEIEWLKKKLEQT
jgi:transposase-like protein